MQINKPSINTNGTSLQGCINCSYDDITDILGYQLDSGFDDYKSDAEWHIEFDDGTVATIYNWKNGRNYLGDQGLYPEEITEWHVGGRDKKALDKVMKVLKIADLTGFFAD